jgi:hypothetical protein
MGALMEDSMSAGGRCSTDSTTRNLAVAGHFQQQQSCPPALLCLCCAAPEASLPTDMNHHQGTITCSSGQSFLPAFHRRTFLVITMRAARVGMGGDLGRWDLCRPRSAEIASEGACLHGFPPAPAPAATLLARPPPSWTTLRASARPPTSGCDAPVVFLLFPCCGTRSVATESTPASPRPLLRRRPLASAAAPARRDTR